MQHSLGLSVEVGGGILGGASVTASYDFTDIETKLVSNSVSSDMT